MAESLANVRDRLNKLRRDFGGQDAKNKENLTGSLTNTMDPTMWLMKISDAGNKPEDWLDYLQYLEHRGQFADVTTKFRTMWSAYNRAMKSINLDVHRRNEAYAHIVVKFAWLKEKDNVDEARILFKFARGNIKPFAFVHIAAAQLERKHNDMEKCINILKKAKELGAQPRDILDTALERCLAGETQLSPPLSEDNGNKTGLVTSVETARPADTPRPPLKNTKPKEPSPRMEVDTHQDSTISFNPPEKRSRSHHGNNSDEADTIPWVNNQFKTFNQQQQASTSQKNNVPVSSSSSSRTRLAQSTSKNTKPSLSLVTPNCKTQQSVCSSSVGGASRRRPVSCGVKATRVRLASQPPSAQLVKQSSNPDDSDDSDSYFVDFQPLSNNSPPEPIAPSSDQVGESKAKPVLQPILESSNSMDSGVGLTPDVNKQPPTFPNNTKPSSIAEPNPVETKQETAPFSVQPQVQEPSRVSQPEFITPAVPSSSTPNVVAPAPVLDVKKETVAAAKASPAEPANEVGPFVPPRMPVRKSKDTITVNGKHYSILSTIGKGGSSKVFEAFSEDKKVLAIKSVNLEYADEMTIKGYLNEITLLHKLRKSDHIIKLYDYEVTDNHLAIVMERGSVDLSTFLKRNKNINGEKIKFYWMEMLEAVEVVHKQGIIHSDLKPANFLFVEGKLKLIDFGIANAIQADKTSVVRESQVGTLNYMSPEAIQDTSPTPQVDSRGHRRPRLKINCKSDVWSLGCILYYMVYGRTPFQQITNTLVKLQAICDPQHEIKFPNIENQFLLDVLKKCLIRDPRVRPSIQDLLQHPFLQSSTQPPPSATEAAASDNGSLTMKQVQRLISQLTQLNSPNTLNTVSRVVMEQVAKGQEINVANVLKPSPTTQEPPPPPPPPQAAPVSHAPTPYSTSGMYHQQYQPQPPVSSGMVPTAYSSGGSSSGLHLPQSMGAGEPVRPIARAPLQMLNMDDLQRAQSSLQPVAQSSSNKYMTHQEKENNDLESVLRRQLAQKYQHAQPQYDESSTYEQTWTTMK